MINKYFNDLKSYFKTLEESFYFVSPTNFNLIDMHNWIPRWKNISYINCFDNKADHTLLIDEDLNRTFSSIEEINEYLLLNPKLQSYLKNDLTTVKQANVLFLFFNKSLEEICKKIKLDIFLPTNSLVKDIDDKITTTEIGNSVGVSSVENVLSHVENYHHLKQLAAGHNLGENLVVQAPFGDSGKTTYFINSEDDYNKYAKKIESEKKVKIMKHINCVGGAIEACATSQGTFVGPLLGELIGFKEITPYKGGWCGNELYQDQFSNEIRTQVHHKTEVIGDALYKRGYKGYFEVDYLIDLDNNTVYLGELNPRITGISALTNLSPFCQSTVPLFFFHLLEYLNKKNSITPKEYNQLSLMNGANGITSQLIIKSTHSELRKVISSPVSGIYKLNIKDELELIKESSEPSDRNASEDYAYLLRIIKDNEFSYNGADRMILFLGSKLTSDKGTTLNDNAIKWINAANNAFKTRELSKEEVILSKMYTSPASTKGATV
jgi:hypothetical protein